MYRKEGNVATILYNPSISTNGTAETPVIETPAPQQTEPVAQATAVEVRLTSAQLKERLDETRAAAERRVLAELGVDSLDKARALVAKANGVAATAADDDGDESPKKNRLRELEFSAAAQAVKIAELESLVVAVTQERATNTLSSLSEPVRKAIEAATDDAEERIALAQVFVAAGLANSPTAAQLPVAIVSTAPPRSAPSDANASAPNRRQEYDRLKKENPVAAAHYLKAFGRDIFPG